MRARFARSALVSLTLGCGAASAAPTETAGPAPITAEESAQMHAWAPEAVAACEAAATATGLSPAWTALDRAVPCGPDADARWTHTRARTGGDASECERCRYEASTRTGTCETPFGRVTWTLDEDGRETHAEVDFDGDGAADGTRETTYDGEGWARSTETTRFGERVTTMVTRTRSAGGVHELEHLDADGRVLASSRTEPDGSSVSTTAEGTITTTCHAAEPGLRLCASSDGRRERIELDAEGRERATEIDEDGDRDIDRRILRVWDGETLAIAETWRREADGTFELATRRVSDETRSLTTGDDGTWIEARTAVCDAR